MEQEERLIRLLIVDEGFHKAEKITSSLRASGMQVRAEFAEDSEDMSDILRNKSLDLVLFSIDLKEFSLNQAQQLIRDCGQHIALIAMAKKVTESEIVRAIDEGAQDITTAGNLEHLIQVIKRESFNIFTWRRAMRLEQDLQESEMRCRNLLASSKDAVAYVHEGMHIFANQAYMDLFGNTDFDELEGTPIIDMIDPSQQNELKGYLRDLSKNEQGSEQRELKLIHRSGETISAELEFSRASFEGEPCTQILIRARADTSELEEQISYLHQHDMVTGLLNRQYFMDQLNAAIGSGENYAICYVAIDNFQNIRDMVGISGCDSLITDLAEILKSDAPDGYQVARFGAYSYICLGKVSKKQEAEDFAARLPVLVEKHIFETGDQSISATCSAVVVYIDANSPDNANEIIARAERTCSLVQERGGNASMVFVPKAGEISQTEEDGLTANIIKDALNHNRIRGLYQPVVGVKAQGGERYISSVEISSEDGRTIHQSDYLAAAERTGTAKMLDRWKILHAIKKIAETKKAGREVEFFVPLSADSLQDNGLADWVGENLDKSEVDGSKLVFMISETLALNNLKAAKALVEDLSKLNCLFAIDDFGAGPNPFQLIKHINTEYVRVNAELMEKLAQNDENQTRIREIAYQAEDQNIKSITPGVTDAAILSVLWTLNVDFVHGDFLQPPGKDLNYDFSDV